MKNFFSFRFLPLLFLFTPKALAQQTEAPKVVLLSLKEAIEIGKSNNAAVQIASIARLVADEDVKDSKNMAMPNVNTNGTYQRFSKLTLFEDGLGGAKSVNRQPSPNGVLLGMDLSFNIYSGGHTKAIIKEQKIKRIISEINLEDRQGNAALLVCELYMALVEQYSLRKLTDDQIERAETRLKTINTLYKNQRVTKSDVLRAELMLSNILLARQENVNNITILNNKLNIALNLNEKSYISPTDSANMIKPDLIDVNKIAYNGETNSYQLKLAKADIETQIAKKEEVHSAYMPVLSFISAYNFTYPNYLFFPPVDQLYSIGYIGLKVSYNLSSIYQNKHKVAAAILRMSESQLRMKSVSDNTREYIQSLVIRYGHSLHKIDVIDKSIEQARANYKIVSTKYQNQLALLTDLLDADNLYQEARFNLVHAQIEATIIYYNILYSTGKI
jgi:outer membrane protein